MDNKETLKCRTCLAAIENANTNECESCNLFEPWKDPWDGMGINIAEDIEKLTQIHIDEKDIFSKTVCHKCTVKLRDMCIFIKFVRDNDKTLKLSVQNVCDLDGIVVKEEVKSDEEEDPTPNWIDGYTISNAEIKTEQEEIQESQYLDNYDNDINSTDYNSLNYTNDENSTEMNGGLPIKEEPLDDEVTDVPLTCLLCTKKYNSLSGLRAHVIALHSYHTISKDSKKQEQTQNDDCFCKICKMTFPTPTELMVHESYHENKKCFKCNQYFTSFQRLSRHSRRCGYRKHNRSKLVTLDDVRRPQNLEQDTSESANIYKCNMCDDRFTDEFYLNIHKETHTTTDYEALEQ